MVWRFVPNIPPAGDPRFDYWGALTLFVSMLSLLLALTFGPDQGFGSTVILSLFTIAGSTFVAFLLIESRVPAPMINLGLFRNTLFSVNLSTGFLTFMAIAGTVLLLTYYLQDMRGFDVQQAGLLLAVLPAALGLTSPISGRISDRVNPRPVTVVGLIVMAIGYWAISTLTLESSIPRYVFSLLPVGLGIGIFQSPNNSAILGAAPRGQLGTASGLLAVTRTLGQTVGLAIFGAIWAARVARYSGGSIPGGATEATPMLQVTAMQDTYQIIAVMMGGALLIALWAAYHERQVERKATRS
jgi:MFS family permease